MHFPPGSFYTRCVLHPVHFAPIRFAGRSEACSGFIVKKGMVHPLSQSQFWKGQTFLTLMLRRRTRMGRRRRRRTRTMRIESSSTAMARSSPTFARRARLSLGYDPSVATSVGHLNGKRRRALVSICASGFFGYYFFRAWGRVFPYPTTPGARDRKPDL